MEKRILLEMRGKKAPQITKLVLDNCRSTSMVGLTDEFANLKALSMNEVGLTSLKGFPKLPNLRKLELSDNRISGGLNVLVSNCPKLASLNLSANKIATLEAIEPLKDLKELEAVDLSTCEVSFMDNYRDKVFAALPTLKFLDCLDKDEKETYQSDEENGKGKPQVDGSSDLDEEEEEEDFDEEEDEDLDGELDEEEEGEVNLSYLEKENIDEESEGEDYSPEEDDEEEVEEEDDEEGGEDNATPRGQKRKLDDSQD